MKLYLICGKARAGKDTFAKLIKQEEEKDNNKVCILKLTAPLYSWAEDYFNYDKEKDENDIDIIYDLSNIKDSELSLRDRLTIGRIAAKSQRLGMEN